MVLLFCECGKSPLVDGLAKELGILLGESRSVQADQLHLLAALQCRNIGKPCASSGLIVWGSEARRRGVPHPVAPCGGGPGGRRGIATRLTASPRLPGLWVLLWRRWPPVAAPGAGGRRGADIRRGAVVTPRLLLATRPRRALMLEVANLPAVEALLASVAAGG